jgi:hypothetical protein
VPRRSDLFGYGQHEIGAMRRRQLDDEIAGLDGHLDGDGLARYGGVGDGVAGELRRPLPCPSHGPDVALAEAPGTDPQSPGLAMGQIDEFDRDFIAVDRRDEGRDIPWQPWPSAIESARSG